MSIMKTMEVDDFFNKYVHEGPEAAAVVAF